MAFHRHHFVWHQSGPPHVCSVWLVSIHSMDVVGSNILWRTGIAKKKAETEDMD